MPEAFGPQTYTLVWFYFTVILASAFIFWETAAFVDGKPNRDTYSAHVWKWLGTRRGWHGPRAVARVLVMLGLAWLIEHFGFGWF